MNIDFTDKVVLITAASAHIAESTAVLFAKLGAKLALVGRNEVYLREVAIRCENEKGQNPLVIVADIATDEGVEKVVQHTLARFRRLDVLINNAVVGRTGIQRADMAAYDEFFHVDVRTVYNLTRQLIPVLVEAKGNVINVLSIAATAITVASLPYGMAKAALDHFTRLIALELAPMGVRVNSVNAGVVPTSEYQEWLGGAGAAVPIRQAYESDDMAYMIAHLASDHSRLLTGTINEIDGGSGLGSQGTLLSRQMK